MFKIAVANINRDIKKNLQTKLILKGNKKLFKSVNNYLAQATEFRNSFTYVAKEWRKCKHGY